MGTQPALSDDEPITVKDMMDYLKYLEDGGHSEEPIYIRDLHTNKAYNIKKRLTLGEDRNFYFSCERVKESAIEIPDNIIPFRLKAE